MGAGQPKQYLNLAGKPVLRHVLDILAATPAIAHTWVVVGAGDAHIAGLVAAAPALGPAITTVDCGGATRRDTVRNGLDAMRGRINDDDWVLVHDAARPGLTVAMLEAMIAALRDDPVGGLLALPLADTIKRADADGRSCGTVARDGLWAAQTPQMFRYSLLRRALAQDAAFTDEASAIEALGLQPKLVPGDPRNLKITLPADLVLAGLYLNAAVSNDHQPEQDT